MFIYQPKNFKSERSTLSEAIGRCHNPNHNRYNDYGGRGIFVHDEWRTEGGFQKFMEYVGPKPSPELTLDRIDNDKGYEPGNLRWATRSEQQRNRRPMSAEGRKKMSIACKRAAARRKVLRQLQMA